MTKNPTEVVIELLSSVSGVALSEIKKSSDLVGDLGIDSPRTLQILVEIEDEFDIEVDDEVLAEMRTVGDILAVIEEHFPADSA